MKILTTVVTHYELVRELTLREIKQRYKQSILGYAWVIVNPLTQMIVMAFVFSKLLRFTDLGVPYPIFLYVGLLPWTLFSNSLTGSASILVENSGLLKKIYFPREIFVLNTIFAKLVDFFLAATVLVLFLLFYQIDFTFYMLWFIPILFVQFILMYGIGLIMATFNLFYRDIQYLLRLLLLVWMYLTPVIYPTEMFPEQYKWIFQLNPMAVLINAYREVLLSGGHPNLSSLTIGFFVSMLILIVGYKIFKKFEGIFADVV